MARRANPPITTPTTVTFDLDDSFAWDYASQDAPWYGHLVGYAAVIRAHKPGMVADTISSRAARFWQNPNVYDHRRYNLGDARRSIVGGASALLAIAASLLISETADAFAAKRK